MFFLEVLKILIKLCFKDPTNMVYEEGKFIRKDAWVLDTSGSN